MPTNGTAYILRYFVNWLEKDLNREIEDIYYYIKVNLEVDKRISTLEDIVKEQESRIRELEISQKNYFSK